MIRTSFSPVNCERKKLSWIKLVWSMLFFLTEKNSDFSTTYHPLYCILQVCSKPLFLNCGLWFGDEESDFVCAEYMRQAKQLVLCVNTIKTILWYSVCTVTYLCTVKWTLINYECIDRLCCFVLMWLRKIVMKLDLCNCLREFGALPSY